MNTNINSLVSQIDDFFDIARLSDFIETNNDIVELMLELSQQKDLDFACPKDKDLSSLVFLINAQSCFLARLKESFDTIK